MSSQTTTPAYAFLSQPPPPSQKKRILVSCRAPAALGPLPPTPIKNKHDRITSWAMKTAPGSPNASSPRRPSVTSASSPSRRRSSFGSLSLRRASVSGVPHGRVASGSSTLDHLIKTPTTGRLYDLVPTSADLKAQGYTTVFVPLPTKTSESTAPFKLAPVPSGKKTLARFRSLSILRPSRRARSSSSAAAMQPPSSPTKLCPPSPIKRAQIKPPRTPVSPATAIRRSKNRRAVLPPNLTNELLMMQFMGGGKLDSHAHQALGDGNAVFRDGQGGLWRDCDEQAEYAALLADERAEGSEWVSFGGQPCENEESALAIFELVEGYMEKRDSDASMNTAELMIHEPMQVDQDLVSQSSSASALPRRLRHRPPPLNLAPPSLTFRDPFAQSRK